MTLVSNEQWRFVPGTRNLYSVSNLGNVRSEDRIGFWGKQKRKYKGKPLNKQVCSRGYYKFYFSYRGKVKGIFIHQAVMWAFVGPQKKGIEVRHINGDHTDNRLVNLTYGTKSDNMQDAIKHGTFPVGLDRPGAYMEPEIVKAIAADRRRQCDIARHYGVHAGCVLAIKRGVYWKDLTEGIRYYKQRFPRKFTKKELELILDRSIKRKHIVDKLGISIDMIKRVRRKHINKG